MLLRSASSHLMWIAATNLRCMKVQTQRGGEIGKYCNDNTPGLITSQTSSIYINWNNPGSNKFKATWKKVAIVCCSSVRMESSGAAAAMYSDFMVTWTQDGEINDRP